MGSRVKPSAVLVAAALSIVAGAAEDRVPRITFEEIASAAAPLAVATGVSLTRAPDEAVWLSWVERARDGANTLRFSVFDSAAKKWAAARIIARDGSIAADAADAPQLALDARGRGFALWTDGRGGARLARSPDRGATWSAPMAFAPGERGIEMFSVATLGDGRVLAAWLAGENPKQLHTQIIDDSAGPRIADASVCDCCPPALTAFPDGSALLAYRGRTREEVRDIWFARVRPDSAIEPRALNHDDWRINGCPVNGPRLASDGGRVAALWFTAADNDPRVLVSFSPDAGARFLMPLRIDRPQAKSAGHGDVALLHDGTILATWVETDGSLWLRRVTPDFAGAELIPLAPAGAVPAQVFPRMALVRDYAGGTTPAQLMVVFATAKSLRTLLVIVPEGELLEAEKSCDCAPTPEQLRGFPIRGTILETADAQGAPSVRASHFEVPGIFDAGTREFKIAPGLTGALPRGRQFLGRIERHGDAWWLFDVRLIAAAAK